MTNEPILKIITNSGSYSILISLISLISYLGTGIPSRSHMTFSFHVFWGSSWPWPGRYWEVLRHCIECPPLGCVSHFLLMRLKLCVLRHKRTEANCRFPLHCHHRPSLLTLTLLTWPRPSLAASCVTKSRGHRLPEGGWGWQGEKAAKADHAQRAGSNVPAQGELDYLHRRFRVLLHPFHVFHLCHFLLQLLTGISMGASLFLCEGIRCHIMSLVLPVNPAPAVGSSVSGHRHHCFFTAGLFRFSLSHFRPLQESPGSSSILNNDIINEGPEFTQVFFVFTGCPLSDPPGPSLP